MATTHTPTAARDDSLDADFFPLPTNIVSPINVNVFRDKLITHPDRELVDFILHRFTSGFDIGYSGPITTGTTRNLLSE